MSGSRTSSRCWVRAFRASRDGAQAEAAAMPELRDDLTGSPLGHATAYPDVYDAGLLFPVPRAPQRREIGLTGPLPFEGADAWTPYQLTWLDDHGKPQGAIAPVVVPAGTPSIVESKSVKLYLGSFAQTRFDGTTDVRATIERDLGHATGGAQPPGPPPPATFPSRPNAGSP